MIDKHCRIPEGMQIGVDLDEDRRRFHVTEKGRVLVVPEMLGQQVHLAASNRGQTRVSGRRNCDMPIQRNRACAAVT